MTAASATQPHKTSDRVAESTPTPTAPGLPGYYSREELAQRLNKSPRTLDRLHTKRQGPPRIAFGAGNRASVILYKIADVERWLDSLAVGPVQHRRVRRARGAHA